MYRENTILKENYERHLKGWMLLMGGSDLSISLKKSVLKRRRKGRGGLVGSRKGGRSARYNLLSRGPPHRKKNKKKQKKNREGIRSSLIVLRGEILSTLPSKSSIGEISKFTRKEGKWLCMRETAVFRETPSFMASSREDIFAKGVYQPRPRKDYVKEGTFFGKEIRADRHAKILILVRGKKGTRFGTQKMSGQKRERKKKEPAHDVIAEEACDKTIARVRDVAREKGRRNGRKGFELKGQATWNGARARYRRRGKGGPSSAILAQTMKRNRTAISK